MKNGRTKSDRNACAGAINMNSVRGENGFNYLSHPFIEILKKDVSHILGNSSFNSMAMIYQENLNCEFRNMKYQNFDFLF